MARTVEIVAGGSRVALNEFTEKIVLNTLLGLIGSLHDVEVDGEIRIVIPAKR
jgi:hypothetical protein